MARNNEILSNLGTLGILPDHVVFSRGARKRIDRALQLGLSETVVERHVITAAVSADQDGKSKVGVFGHAQDAFRKMDEEARLGTAHAARLAAVRSALSVETAKQ